MTPFLGAALEAIDDAVAPLDARTIGRPIEGRWSIAEILEHLTLAFRYNTATFEKVLASGELRGRAPSLKQLVFRTVVLDLGYFPRVEAPKGTQPEGAIAPEQSLRAVRDAIVTLDAALTRVADRFGERVYVANHPYLAGFTVPHWRKFHWRHTLHHMRQVRARATR